MVGRRVAYRQWTVGVSAAVLILAAVQTLHSQETVPDRAITEAIESAFHRDGGVPAEAIEVRTQLGVVTLAGTVESLLARDRAQEIARAMRGVRSVVNTVEVKPAVKDDVSLRRDVLAALAAHPVTEPYEVGVQVDAGTVTVTGATDSWYEKELALAVVRGVTGVRDVRDAVDVILEGSRSDDEIAEEVRARLDWDARVDAELIEVSVSNGRVTLRGRVGSAAERAQAYSDAWVPGVVAVETETLTVDWAARREMIRQDFSVTDAEIQEAVVDAFVHDPRVWSGGPEVTVTNGIVTLTGQVTGLEEWRAAEEDTRNTFGVRQVRNELQVRPLRPPTDTVLANRVRRELKRDPFMEPLDVTVIAVDGEVELSGAVRSVFERRRAETLTERVNGVARVLNLLTVEEPPSKTDEAIAAAIRAQLRWSPLVDVDEITVRVDEGVAMLEGTVDTARARRVAAAKALDGGARDVRNNLRVRTESAWPVDADS